ncbi:unnamed protein product [Effrenium voratum]|uniref:Beta-galactosidase n=1 Tax=Effrenium voratum TaxID=2562239 RepID=A0AA36JDK6_9DINO|nr:unnamed protein product [Effrenium voratum]
MSAKMLTKWGEQITESPWPEYPRPQMVREKWWSLNGLWRCRVSQEAETPERMLETMPEKDRQILVPFCLESTLGGVGQNLEPHEELWYHRTFEWEKRESRLLLHFEAVDYCTTVWVNGVKVGEHKGGFTPFEFDVTEAAATGSNQLVMRVTDATGNFQPRGKQSKAPHKIWYTRVSGIWQSVWLEEVPMSYISSLQITVTSLSPPCVQVQAILAGECPPTWQLRVMVLEGKELLAEAEGSESRAQLELVVPKAKLWSPQRPHLYDLRVELCSDGRVLDVVDSYVGIRTVGKKKDVEGHWRLTLNEDCCFHLGPLDQGWWPDGLLTPPSDEAMRYDLEFLKEAGFNMVRKHVKVEPRRYYFHCDQLGLMVWQDQVSGTEKEGDCFKVPPWTRLQPGGQDASNWPAWAKEQFRAELREMVDGLRNHPSVTVWVLFNEAWGQHDSLEIGRWLQSYDPSRLINIASGGNFFEVGDMVDHHNYPEPTFPMEPMDDRFRDYVKVIGEFGGHGLVLPAEHLWQTAKKHWGYDVLQDISELEAKYQGSIQNLCHWMRRGIAAGVYTQTTDVECEVNGLLSYDRKVTKLGAAVLAKAHKELWAAELEGPKPTANAGYNP